MTQHMEQYDAIVAEMHKNAETAREKRDAAERAAADQPAGEAPTAS